MSDKDGLSYLSNHQEHEEKHQRQFFKPPQKLQRDAEIERVEADEEHDAIRSTN